MTKLIAFALAVACFACTQTNNVGQCQETQTACGANTPCTVAGQSCGHDGFCVVCTTDTTQPPDGPGACVAPDPNTVTCTTTTDCSNYPGTVCGPNHDCYCGVTPGCVAPDPNTVTCTTTTDCSNYPGTVCGPNHDCYCGVATPPN